VLFEYVVRLSRKTLVRGRATVWERRDREVSTMSPYQQRQFLRRCGQSEEVLDS
jgi:hypothetical protein